MKKGVTLTEVLITLGIIGVVVSMTLSVSTQINKEKKIVTQVKTIYSILNNALLLAVKDYGDMANWNVDVSYFSIVPESERIKFFYDYLVPYLNIAKICTKHERNMNHCWKEANESSAIFKNISGAGAYEIIAIAILNNGMSCGITARATNTVLICDINSYHEPNRLGRDQYSFILNPKKNNLEFIYYDLSRENLVKSAAFDINGGACVNGNKRYDGQACGALIQRDGWRINKDYP